jgi:signal transduction histidine kinase
MSAAPPSTHRRLLLRVYLYGILMLVLAAVAAFVVGRYVLRPAFDAPPRPSSSWIAFHMASLVNDPPRLEHELADLKARVGIELTLFRGPSRLATNADEPPGALTEKELQRLTPGHSHFERGRGIVVTEGRGSGATYALVRYPEIEFPWAIAAAQLAVVLAVLALLSIPLARSISAPVEQLRDAVRAFGSGNLAARAALRSPDEIGDLARAFDEMADRITELRRSEKELLANVSHELRTPLARIRLALELLADGDATKAQSYLGDIDDDLAELETLLDDVLTAARLDLANGAGRDGAFPLRLERISVRSLLLASVRRFEKRHPERRLTPKLELDSELVDADPPLLRRVVDNLLDNAVKFSDVECPVELAGHHDARHDRVVVEVRDRGVGIPKEEHERIFNPFFRGDPSRTRSTGGVGLGLALARRVVEAHGGSIDVTSEPGQGSRFRVSLPASPAGT